MSVLMQEFVKLPLARMHRREMVAVIHDGMKTYALKCVLAPCAMNMCLTRLKLKDFVLTP